MMSCLHHNISEINTGGGGGGSEYLIKSNRRDQRSLDCVCVCVCWAIQYCLSVDRLFMPQHKYNGTTMVEVDPKVWHGMLGISGMEVKEWLKCSLLNEEWRRSAINAQKDYL